MGRAYSSLRNPDHTSTKFSTVGVDLFSSTYQRFFSCLVQTSLLSLLIWYMSWFQFVNRFVWWIYDYVWVPHSKKRTPPVFLWSISGIANHVLTREMGSMHERKNEHITFHAYSLQNLHELMRSSPLYDDDVLGLEVEGLGYWGWLSSRPKMSGSKTLMETFTCFERLVLGMFDRLSVTWGVPVSLVILPQVLLPIAQIQGFKSGVVLNKRLGQSSSNSFSILC